MTVKIAARSPGAQRAFEAPFGGVYGYYMARPALARAIARLVWGGDVSPLYTSVSRIAAVPPGGLVVDAPRGAGVAFPGQSPAQDVRYVAVDLSPRMLERAHAEARRRALSQIEFVAADAAAVPVESGSVDLFLAFGPVGAVADLRRWLDEAGLEVARAEESGCFAYFSATPRRLIP